MQLMELEFDNELNTSLQVGDTIFYVDTGSKGSFNVGGVGDIVMLGELQEIRRDSGGKYILSILYDNVNVPSPTGGEFIMFVKNKEVNTNSLLGYYAKVAFENDSTKDVELFSVGSNIFESSK